MPQFFSDATGARTQAPYIKSVMLYLLSYGIDPDYYYFEILTSVIKKNCGKGRIRTSEAEALDLQSSPFDRSGTFP